MYHLSQCRRYTAGRESTHNPSSIPQRHPDTKTNSSSKKTVLEATEYMGLHRLYHDPNVQRVTDETGTHNEGYSVLGGRGQILQRATSEHDYYYTEDCADSSGESFIELHHLYHDSEMKHVTTGSSGVYKHGYLVPERRSKSSETEKSDQNVYYYAGASVVRHKSSAE